MADNERQLKAMAIAATTELKKSADGTWAVPSQSNRGRYSVAIGEHGKFCTCPDFELRQQPCKHVMAVEFVIRRETVTEDTPEGAITTTTETAAVRVTYSQNWSAYNAAQTNEKAMFQDLLRDLLTAVPEPPAQVGHPRLPIRDSLFAAAFKVYSTVSARRFMTDLRTARASGHISCAPSFNTVLRCIDNEEMTPIIKGLITRSALPLRALETDFAIDSTGFTSTQLVGLWQTEKYGAPKHRVEHDWLKLHAVVGCRTNVVVAAEVNERNSQDSPQFAPLVGATMDNFNVERMLGDKAYSSYANLEQVDAAGASALIPFKSYAVGTSKSEVWNRMFHFFSLHREDFLAGYHKRSNVESSFSAIKRLLTDSVRAKSPVGQINEILLKCLCYNIMCLIHEIHALGIKPTFLSAPAERAA